MATSQDPSLSTQRAKEASSGLVAGSGPDLSGRAQAPKSSSRSRGKTQTPEGASTQPKPAEGLSAAKPVSKAKGKSPTRAKRTAKTAAAPSQDAEAGEGAGGTSGTGDAAAVDPVASAEPAPSSDPLKGAARPAPSSRAGTAGGVSETAAGSETSAMSEGQAVQSTASPPEERMSDAERQRRIAERAYRKAQERGFRGDRHLDDWLDAEREHDQGS